MTAISRRELLAASGTGLVIAFLVPRRAEAMLAGPPSKKKKLPPPNAFLRIGSDESVTILLAHSEMGQGIWTTLPMLVAEELDCDWAKIRVEHAPAAPVYAHAVYGMQMTGGSTTTWSEFERYRTVGATARHLLSHAAAEQWKTDPATHQVENGHVIAGTRRATFGQLAERAAALPTPEKVTLKSPSKWRLVGKPTRRLDTPEKITGRAQFGIDVQFPGLRVAMVATLAGLRRQGPLVRIRPRRGRSRGSSQVVQVPSGVAVVATSTWAAKLGRAALKTEWDLGPGASLDTEAMRAEARAQSRTDGDVALAKGDVKAALGKASRRLEADYEVPYLAHAPMEPLNCTVKVDGDRCDIWTGTQFQTMDQKVASEILG
jgi:isoquinoline 1-oxidoreductase beta subunit